MRHTRLESALDSGAVTLPEQGRIAVLSPTDGDDLSTLPRDRVVVVQGFRPDHDAFARQGYAVAIAAEGAFGAALVCLPRSRAQGKSLIAQAVALVGPGGMVLVDGQKTDGIDTMVRDCKARVAITDPVVKAHGRLFWFEAEPVFGDWAALAEPTVIDGGYLTGSGVFSAGHVDEGSAALAAALPPKLGGKIADLGAGWGYLSAEILKRADVKQVHLIEADHAALELARRNVSDPRAQFHWADARSFKLVQKLDTVVMNPPFHVGRDADPALGVAFIRAAAALLSPGGVLWMVANRHLPYKATLEAAFREVEAVQTTAGFRVFRAAKPVRDTARPG